MDNPTTSATPQPVEQDDRANQRKAPPVPCEQCGRETEPWKITFHNGRRLCSDCVLSAAPPPTPAWRLPALIGAVALGLILVGTAVFFAAKVPQKMEISKSFYARTAAYHTEDEEVVADYIDYETVVQEITSAAQTAGDPNPSTAAEAIWVQCVGPATLSGKVLSIRGDTAVVEGSLDKLPNGQPGRFVVRYQLERSNKEIWRVTHVLNADDLYRSYSSASPQ